MGITPEDIPSEILEKEKGFARQQALDSGKPENVVDKIVEGKVGKFIADLALLEQEYVKEKKTKVKDILGKAKVTEFVRFAVGEDA
jgi:elongation factor Ts